MWCIDPRKPEPGCHPTDARLSHILLLIRSARVFLFYLLCRMCWLLIPSDRVFGTNSMQKEVFLDAALPIVEGACVFARPSSPPLLIGAVCILSADVLEGFNGCLLAYGQTGAGKTHTMMGPSIDDDNEKVWLRVCAPRPHTHRFSCFLCDRGFFHEWWSTFSSLPPKQMRGLFLLLSFLLSMPLRCQLWIRFVFAAWSSLSSAPWSRFTWSGSGTC